MKIGQKFNRLTVKEYLFYIDNYKKYKDFNVLGIYRSITENDKLSLDDKISVREYAHKFFKKQFDFLQLKDAVTFVELSTLGEELTTADENQIWKNVRLYQEKVLKDKKIKHRNFGTYSKHLCGYETCPYNGIMIRQGSPLMEGNMHFHTDKTRYNSKQKSEIRKKERKQKKQLILSIIQSESDNSEA